MYLPAIAASLCAQFPDSAMREAVQLDLDGKGAEARLLFQKHIDDAASPRVKADAQRAMAMSSRERCFTPGSPMARRRLSRGWNKMAVNGSVLT
jgi:hypothetical protein